MMMSFWRMYESEKIKYTVDSAQNMSRIRETTKV